MFSFFGDTESLAATGLFFVFLLMEERIIDKKSLCRPYDSLGFVGNVSQKGSREFICCFHATARTSFFVNLLRKKRVLVKLFFLAKLVM